MSLVAFMLQNVFQTISVRYVRTRQMDMFFSTTAVCLAELIKFVAALFLILLQERCNIFAWFNQIKDNIIKQPLDCLKIAGLAFLFLIQNNLHYVAATNLEAVTFQVNKLFRSFVCSFVCSFVRSLRVVAYLFVHFVNSIASMILCIGSIFRVCFFVMLYNYYYYYFDIFLDRFFQLTSVREHLSFIGLPYPLVQTEGFVNRM